MYSSSWLSAAEIVGCFDTLDELNLYFDKLTCEQIDQIFERLYNKNKNILSEKLYSQLLNRLEHKKAAERLTNRFESSARDSKSSSPVVMSPTKVSASAAATAASPTNKPASPTITKKSSSPTPPEQKMQLTALYKEQKFLLNRRIVANDGDCALTAIRLKRAQATELLESEIPKNAKVRSLIAPEIQAAFLEVNFKHIFKGTKEEKEFTRLLQEREKLDLEIRPIMSKGRKFLSGDELKQADKLSKLLELLKKQSDKILTETEKDKLSIIQTILTETYSSEDKIDNVAAKDWLNDAKRTYGELINNFKTKAPDVYTAMQADIENNFILEVENLEKAERNNVESVKKLSLEIPVQEAFFKKHIKTGWLTFNSDRTSDLDASDSTSSLDAIAELFKKHILVFYLDDKTGILTLNHEYKPSKVEEYEVLFLTDHIHHKADGSFKIEKNVHYDKLEPVNAAEFEKTLGFVRKAPSPTSLSADIKADDNRSSSYSRNSLFANSVLDSKYNSNNDYDLELLNKFYTVITRAALQNKEAINPFYYSIMVDNYRECCVYYKTCSRSERDTYTINLYQILTELYIPPYKELFKDSLMTIILQSLQDNKSNNPLLKLEQESTGKNPYLREDIEKFYAKHRDEIEKAIPKKHTSRKYDFDLLQKFFATVRFVISESELDEDTKIRILLQLKEHSNNFHSFTEDCQGKFMKMNYQYILEFYLPYKSCYRKLQNNIDTLAEQVEQDLESNRNTFYEAARMALRNPYFAAAVETYKDQKNKPKASSPTAKK